MVVPEVVWYLLLRLLVNGHTFTRGTILATLRVKAIFVDLPKVLVLMMIVIRADA